MKYHIIRHAQTNANSLGHLSCENDESLNEEGKKQAMLLSNYLATFQIDDIIVSPLPRALATLKPYCEKTGRKASINPFLAEGMYNLDPNAGIADPLFENTGYPVKDETIPLFRGRVNKFINEIISDTDAGTKVVIAHGQFIRELLNMLLDAKRYVRWPVGNCSETLIDIQSDIFIRHVNKNVIQQMHLQ